MSYRVFTVRTPKNRAKFLDALREGSTVTIAAKAAGFTRNAAYDWRKDDPEFLRDWEDAIEAGTGVEKPVFQKGELVGHVQEYSDTLMIFLLKGRNPNKFKERVHAEHTGKDGGPIQHEVSARDELASRIAGIAERAREEEGPRVLN
jgi:hypothetical protein